MDRRGRQFGPRMPLVPSLLKTFPWAYDCRTLTRKPGWAGRGLHSIGRGWKGQDEKEGQLLALSSPVAGDWRRFLAQSKRSVWRWEEEELGI